MEGENMNWKFILWLIGFSLVLVLVSSCRSSKNESVVDTKIVYKDSIAWKDSLIEVPVPYEVVKEVCPSVDTLHLQTSVAEAWAWLDLDTKNLIGRIQNKSKEKLQSVVKIPTRYIKKTITIRTTNYKIKYKTKEVKYIPGWVKTLAWIGGIILFCFLVSMFMYVYNLVKP